MTEEVIASTFDKSSVMIGVLVCLAVFGFPYGITGTSVL